MKQIFQNLRNGRIEVRDLPAPRPGRNEILIKTTASLVSPGTERMLADFGKAGWIGKARLQPDKLRQVLAKIKTDGLEPTIRAVFGKLDTPLPLGYCNAGVVLETGSAVTGFAPGDRVISNGPHAEVVCVSENLCAKVPEGVSDDAAVFTVLSAIALQGVRLVGLQVGENAAVIGLGLIGLLGAQLLRAAGARVIGFDLDEEKCELARSFGIEAFSSQSIDPVKQAQLFSSGRGVDGVLIAAATTSSDPMHQAPQMCCQRGKVVLVGVSGLELSRADFYEKEITFQVSCSYGPGRYDPSYEQDNVDYPYGFVRWTEKRNFAAVLELMRAGALKTAPLITTRVPFADVPKRYDSLLAEQGALGTLIEYQRLAGQLKSKVEFSGEKVRKVGGAVLGFIGAGSHARGVLLPAFAKTGAVLKGVCSKSGVAAADLGKKYGFSFATSNYCEILEDSEINAVIISTRHDTHAKFVCAALEAGKHVYVEKPLCLSEEEYLEIQEVHSRHKDLVLMIGFNRRYAPLTARAIKLLAGRREPLCMTMIVNAGDLRADHWAHDPLVGGGRIIGEACHFEDLLQFIAGSEVETRHLTGISAPDGLVAEDKATITLKFKDGSIGTVHYFANGSKQYPKERLLIFSDGRVLELDNFKELRAYGCKRFKRASCRGQDKGHAAAAAEFIGKFSKST